MVCIINYKRGCQIEIRDPTQVASLTLPFPKMFVNWNSEYIPRFKDACT